VRRRSHRRATADVPAQLGPALPRGEAGGDGRAVGSAATPTTTVPIVVPVTRRPVGARANTGRRPDV
jgi:hypothetical protein